MSLDLEKKEQDFCNLKKELCIVGKEYLEINEECEEAVLASLLTKMAFQFDVKQELQFFASNISAFLQNDKFAKMLEEFQDLTNLGIWAEREDWEKLDTGFRVYFLITGLKNLLEMMLPIINLTLLKRDAAVDEPLSPASVTRDMLFLSEMVAVIWDKIPKDYPKIDEHLKEVQKKLAYKVYDKQNPKN